MKIDTPKKHTLYQFGVSLLALSAVLASPSHAQDKMESNKLEPVSVTANRFGGSLDRISRSITVINRDELQKHAATSDNIAEILGKVVPGMAPASGTLTNFSQTTRGRNVLVIIDGVPMNTNRNASRDLFNIDVEAVESIEIVKGGSALYGNGGTGGVIHITTNSGKAGAEPEFTTKIESALGLSRLSSDALSAKVIQQGTGSVGQVGYHFTLSGEQEQGIFDAEGKRIPTDPSQGAMSDALIYDFLGKLSYNTDERHIQLTANYMNAEQDSNYLSDPSVSSIAAGQANARAIEGLQLDKQNRVENLYFNLDYNEEDVLGSQLKSNIYFRKYHTRFTPFDGRRFSTWNALAQSYVDSQSFGGKVTMETPIEFENDQVLNIMWGADYNNETTEMPVTTYDGTAYDNSGGKVFIETGDRLFMPEVNTQMVGLYSQFEYMPTENLTLRAGGRYDYATASFDNYTTLGQGNSIQGGDIDYDAFTFNTGVVYDVTESTAVYADYAQAFELPDIGLQLRYAPTGFNVNSSSLEPIKTHNYEIGMRNDFGHTKTSLATFYNTSKLGRVTIQNFGLSQQRQKERVYGLEGTVDHHLDENWMLGATMTLMEGQSYNETTQKWVALNGYRIPPMKLTAYVDGAVNDWWDVRVQGLYSGKRDSANDDGVGFGGRTVKDYAVFDLFNNFDLPVGELKVGVENVLNTKYHTVYGQLLRNNTNTSHVLARGATLRVGYEFKW